MKKILFCDMDGTIVDFDGWLHLEDKEAIDKLHEAGYLFALNTGRNFEEATRTTNKLKIKYDYLVLNNGAHIFDKDNKEIFKKVIAREAGIDIIEHCLEYSNLWIFFFDGEKTLSYYQGQTYKYDEHSTVPTDEYDFIKEYKNVEEFGIIAINQDNSQIDEVLKIQEYIAKNHSNDAHGTLNTIYLDITPAGCSKGTGITSLVELLGDNVESYAIGDSYNDISMFEHANYGYTFKHVADDIAKHTCKQVDRVADLIEDMLK